MLLKAHQLTKRWPAFQAGFVLNLLVVVSFCSLHRTLNLYSIYNFLYDWTRCVCVCACLCVNAFVHSTFSFYWCCFCWPNITIHTTILIPKNDSNCSSLGLIYSYAHTYMSSIKHTIFSVQVRKKKEN